MLLPDMNADDVLKANARPRKRARHVLGPDRFCGSLVVTVGMSVMPARAVQARMKKDMIVANQRQMELKAARQAEAAAQEERFRQSMLDKFAEDDRIEQMNAQKRRMKMLEHRREVRIAALSICGHSQLAECVDEWAAARCCICTGMRAAFLLQQPSSPHIHAHPNSCVKFKRHSLGCNDRVAFVMEM